MHSYALRRGQRVRAHRRCGDPPDDRTV